MMSRKGQGQCELWKYYIKMTYRTGAQHTSIAHFAERVEQVFNVTGSQGHTAN